MICPVLHRSLLHQIRSAELCSIGAARKDCVCPDKHYNFGEFKTLNQTSTGMQEQESFSFSPLCLCACVRVCVSSRARVCVCHCACVRAIQWILRSIQTCYNNLTFGSVFMTGLVDNKSDGELYNFLILY